MKYIKLVFVLILNMTSFSSTFAEADRGSSQQVFDENLYSDQSTVRLVGENLEILKLKDIKPGDWVFSHYRNDSKAFSEVLFSPQCDSLEENFVSIKTVVDEVITSPKNRVFVSYDTNKNSDHNSSHFIHFDLKAEDIIDELNSRSLFLVGQRNELHQIISAKIVKNRGCCMPITWSGSIVISAAKQLFDFYGYKVSCFSPQWMK